MSNIRIMHISISYLPKIGGAEILIHNLARNQILKGYSVYILTAWNKYIKICKMVNYQVLPFLPKSVSISLLLEKYKFVRLSKLIFSIQIWVYCKIIGINLCHVHFAYPEGYYAIDVLIKMKIPAILTCHGGDININKLYGYGIRLDKEIDRKVRNTLVKFDMLSALSLGIRTEFIKLGVSRHNIKHIPNGTDISRIQSFKQKACEHSEKDGPLRLLTVARNIPSKGLSMIIPIAKILAEMQVAFEWHIVGSGVKKLIVEDKTNLIDDKIFLFPNAGSEWQENKQLISLPTENIINHYYNSDVFVFLSAVESFGLVVLEAMAAGLPVVAFSVAGVEELVKNNKNGILCEFGDIFCIARAIQKLNNNRKALESYSINNTRSADAYDIKKTSNKYNEVYNLLIERYKN